MARLIKAVTESFSDMDSWKEISDTFGQHKGKFVGAETAVEQACERVRLNAAWRAKDIGKSNRNIIFHHQVALRLIFEILPSAFMAI